jgi:hypothetical protein
MAKMPKALEFFQAVKSQQLGIAADSILKSTIQFYYNKPESGRLAANASGVLLTVDNRFFVVTAAHVLAKHYSDTFVLLADTEATLGGQLYTTEGTAEDRIDLAVLELTDATQLEQFQQEYHFLTLADISTHQTHKTSQYLLVGYPATKTKVYDGIIVARPYPLQAELSTDFDYAKHGVQRATHLVLASSGNVVSGANTNPHKRPRLKGVSGGGVWHNGNYLQGDPAHEKRLVGILTEEITEHGRKSLLITRTTVLLEFMRQRFGLSIPASQTVKVNLRDRSATQ